jgi:nitrogen fixation protein FixH
MKRSARMWPIAIVAVLGSTVVANVALLVATRGDGAAVEPDYYGKALRWDETLAARAASDALGWRADATLEGLDRDGRALVRVRITDRGGVPVRDARVRVTAIHNLDPLHPVTGALAPAPSGRYATRLPLGRLGWWELRLEADRGDQRFVADLRADLAPARSLAATTASRDGP